MPSFNFYLIFLGTKKPLLQNEWKAKLVFLWKYWAFVTEVTIKETWKWKQEKQLIKYFGSQTPSSINSSINFTESKHTVLLGIKNGKQNEKKNHRLMEDMI